MHEGEAKVIRLQFNLQPVGRGHHRSGWPYAWYSLQLIHDYGGMLFEDFVERSFTYRRMRRPYNEPFAAVFHNPPRMPMWFDAKQDPRAVFSSPLWIRSVPHLKVAFALSEYLAAWLRTRLDVPVHALIHPTEIPKATWNAGAFLENRERKIIQVGWWLRNTQAIYQLPWKKGWQKVALKLEHQWVKTAEQRVADFWFQMGTRKWCGEVLELPRVSNEVYDVLLSSNVVFLELFDTSANNAVVECLARDCPIIVNRHPAVEEYLGKDYPGFYDDFDDAGKLFTEETILDCYEHIAALDKTRLSGAVFREGIRRGVKEVLKK